MNSNDSTPEEIDLYDVEWIQTRSDFYKFVVALSENAQSSRRDWDNSDLISYLGGLEGAVHDVHGYYFNQKIAVDADVPSWRVFADILRMARVYE